MADFRLIAGEKGVAYDGASNTFVMLPSTTGYIALWGGGPPPNYDDLFVVSLDESVLEVRDLTYVSIPLGPNLHRISLTAKKAGTTSIEARLGQYGPAWAKAAVVVGTSGAVAAGEAGRIISIGGLTLVPGGNQADFLRDMYQKGTEKILADAKDMIAAGKTEEEAARFVVEARNELKVVVRNSGPNLYKKFVEYRNVRKYGNPIGPDYQYLRQNLAARGIAAEKIDGMIIEGVVDTSKGFNAAGGKIRFIGTVGEVVGFAVTAMQDSPAGLPPLPKTPAEEIETERARLRLGIPAGANIDRHGHLKSNSYLQIDTFDPHAGDEMAQETDEILWFLGVSITYHYRGVTWTVPGR